MGPLIYLQEQIEVKTQVEDDTIKAALRCSLAHLGAHISVERRKCIMKPLTESQFPDRGSDLFGKSFRE